MSTNVDGVAYVTTHEAAEMLGLTPGSFKTLKSDGRIALASERVLSNSVVYRMSAVQAEVRRRKLASQ